MEGANSSERDKLPGNRKIDGEFGRLNCDGRTLERVAFTVNGQRSTFNVQLLLHEKRLKITKSQPPCTRGALSDRPTDAGHARADVNDVTSDPGNRTSLPSSS